MMNKGNVDTINMIEKCFLSESACRNLSFESLQWADKLNMWTSVLSMVFDNDPNLKKQDWTELYTVISCVCNSVSMMVKALELSFSTTKLKKLRFNDENGQKKTSVSYSSVVKGGHMKFTPLNREKIDENNGNGKVSRLSARYGGNVDRRSPGRLQQVSRPATFRESQRQRFLDDKNSSILAWRKKVMKNGKNNDTTKQVDNKLQGDNANGKNDANTTKVDNNKNTYFNDKKQEVYNKNKKTNDDPNHFKADTDGNDEVKEASPADAHNGNGDDIDDKVDFDTGKVGQTNVDESNGANAEGGGNDEADGAETDDDEELLVLSGSKPPLAVPGSSIAERRAQRNIRPPARYQDSVDMVRVKKSAKNKLKKKRQKERASAKKALFDEDLKSVAEGV